MDGGMGFHLRGKSDPPIRKGSICNGYGKLLAGEVNELADQDTETIYLWASP